MTHAEMGREMGADGHASGPGGDGFHQIPQFQHLAEEVIRRAVLDMKDPKERQDAEEFLFSNTRLEDLKLWTDVLGFCVDSIREWAHKGRTKRGRIT